MPAPARRTVIIGTGSHLPERVVPNAHFLDHQFRGRDGRPLKGSNQDLLRQFETITGIVQRRWAPDGLFASDLGADAARAALSDAAADPESLDYILVAHNFGDVRAGTAQVDAVPALAARVKRALGIRNPRCVALDVVFGCPGWLQAVILADALIRAGEIRRALVVGAETLSRVIDPHDRDGLLYADGAGAVVLEARETSDPVGILARGARSDALEHSGIIGVGPSNEPNRTCGGPFIKMEGRRVYKYAVSTVAPAIKEVLDEAGVTLAEVSKLLLHQANGKMIDAIVSATAQLCGSAPRPDLVPTTVAWLGNSSVATLPTLLDLVRRGQLGDHRIGPGDCLVFGAVGAGMHVNAVV
ncbi:MAG: ketoacyl-ACP synthase III [Vicinamibacteria bacterium]